MDMMALRRMVMAQMAQSGADFVKGSFTVPDSGSSFTLNFGKIFSKYIWYVEMQDTDKNTLLATDYNANKTFAFLGAYPNPQLNNITVNNKAFHSFRVNPSTSTPVTLSATVSTIDGSSIMFPADAVSGSANAVYRGYAYNYYIVEIK